MRKNRKPSGRFFLLPNSIFQEGLLPRDLSVYCCLKFHSGEYFTCFPSRKTIAKECRISLPTVDAALKVLEDKGLISITHRFDINTGNRQSHLYTINN